ncbi:diguanylate cyclase (GGDEF) domain protein [compost metagenome]
MPRPEHSDQHRRLVLKALLWLTLFGGVFFSAVNVLRENWVLAVLEFSYSLISLYSLLVINRTENLRTLTLIYLVPFFTLMMVILFQPRTSFSVFAWIQTIPIIFYLLLGLRLGLWGSLLFIGIGLFAFSQRFTSDNPVTNILILANLGAASLAVTLFSHIYERSRLRNEQRLTELATTDNLTGLANRMKLAEVFERERSHAQRNRTPLALVFLDIDHFKQINDRFGHKTGDKALCHFARVLSQRLRSGDLFCRLGGEEFAVLLPNTSAEQAAAIGQSLCERLAATPLPLEEGTLPMTLSAGVANYGQDGEQLDELMQAADRRTYSAKRAGRNRVTTRDSLDAAPAAGYDLGQNLT